MPFEKAMSMKLARQADVMYDEEIERQNNMPTVHPSQKFVCVCVCLFKVDSYFMWLEPTVCNTAKIREGNASRFAQTV